jgi:hypothetical protein
MRDLLDMFGIFLICAVMVLGSFAAGIAVGTAQVIEAQKKQTQGQKARPVKVRVLT